MYEYTHHVSGFFVKREEAQMAFYKLNARGIPLDQLKIYDNEKASREPAADANSNTLLENMVVDGAVGAAVGTGVGVLAEVALVVANVSLFILVAPLAMLGWGASLGGVIGAAVGSESTEKKDGKLSDLVQDAIMNGQVVLVAKTHSEQETDIAQEVIKEAVGDFKDVRIV
ncbi:MAG: hypothetical protein FD135_254 [Comamonadaceae bacterium]|nr:MAG: hypothetical protein FD135_254 [Comamonadaceae bacterium]